MLAALEYTGHFLTLAVAPLPIGQVDRRRSVLTAAESDKRCGGREEPSKADGRLHGFRVSFAPGVVDGCGGWGAFGGAGFGAAGGVLDACGGLGAVACIRLSRHTKSRIVAAGGCAWR